MLLMTQFSSMARKFPSFESTAKAQTAVTEASTKR